MLESLLSEMRARGFEPPSLNLTGEYQRFSRGKSQDSAWVVGAVLPSLATATYGDWSTGEKYTWRSDAGATYSPEQAAQVQLELAEAAKQAELAEQARQEACALEAEKLWAALNTDSVSSPYLTKKGLASGEEYGLRGRGSDLFVPLRDAHGKLWGLQKISASGEKRFLPGSRITACMHTLPGGDTSKVYLAEGLATAASIWDALERAHPVVTCFNAGNLAPCAQEIREKSPTAEIIICGDEDILTVRAGVPYNTGRVKALEAAELVQGRAVFPVFTQDEAQAKLTDFNDLREPARILASLAQPEHPEPNTHRVTNSSPSDRGSGQVTTDPELRTLVRHPGPVTKDGKLGAPIRPSQQKIAASLLEFYGQNLIKCESEVFKYTGTHWKLCGDKEHDLFFRQLQKLAGTDFKAGEIESCLRIFLKNIPHVPGTENLFEPRSDRANFKNGTLHLNFRYKTVEEMAREPGASPYAFKLDFRPHAREDFCTTVLPLEYKLELAENPEFLPALKRIWPDSDPDQADKIRLYEELLGAALVPIFSKLVFFDGDAKAGKSMLIMLFSKLVGPENMGSVDPGKFGESFHLEPLMYKLVNSDTDIDTHTRINDSVMKKILDRPLMAINRKGRKIVYARLPGLHCFGCNGLPPSIGNTGGVYERRMVVVKCETVQAGSGGGGEYSEWLWAQGPEGILKAALRGLERLLRAGGQYTIPVSSREALGAWVTENDSISQFINAVREGEIPGSEGGKQLTLSLGQDLEIWKDLLYQEYLKWMKMALPRSFTVSQVMFSRALTKSGKLTKKVVEGRHKWSGIGWDDRAGGQF